MNDTLVNQIALSATRDLQAFSRLCEEVLSLCKSEYEVLSGRADYPYREFSEKRKALLPDIESLLDKFRRHRAAWRQVSQAQREHYPELTRLFQVIQGLLTKVLLLDRENQRAMLKRGLVPAKHLPETAAVQQQNFVANLYRKNSSV